MVIRIPENAKKSGHIQISGNMVMVISFVGHSDKHFTVRTRCTNEKGEAPINDQLFFSYGDARAHVSAIRRQWLIETFKDYVQHKVILYKTSAGDHYRVPSRLNSLTRLENAVKYLQLQSTPELCSLIQRSENLLRNVLPHSANHSYEAQEAKIGQMLKVVGDELTNKLGIFPFRSTHKEIYYT